MCVLSGQNMRYLRFNPHQNENPWAISTDGVMTNPWPIHDQSPLAMKIACFDRFSDTYPTFFQSNVACRKIPQPVDYFDDQGDFSAMFDTSYMLKTIGYDPSIVPFFDYYPVVNVYKKLWKDPPFFMGKIHYKLAFSIAMLVYQRVDHVQLPLDTQGST